MMDAANKGQELAEIALAEGMSATQGQEQASPKRVVLGVTGCVAAYKACEVARGLQKAGVEVHVVMTQHATEFISPTLMRALTRQSVGVGLFDDKPQDPIHHISLAKLADVFLVAPCSANVMAKMAHGIADDLLTTTALAVKAPIVLAPCMNTAMYENPATQANMQTLKDRGVIFVDAVDGYLACGDVGKGKLADVDDIVAQTLAVLERGAAQQSQAYAQDLAGKKVLITAGPTQEPIDPVRYISNHSSGKTGFALARAAQMRGADVTMVTGPVNLPDIAGVETVHVQTARQMMDAVDKAFDQADIAIFSAAVCDMRPEAAATGKLKKGIDDELLSQVKLTPNPDILATCAQRKQPGQVVVGFAAETDDCLANAQAKLASKHADYIVANEVGNGKAFGTDSNSILIVSGLGVKEFADKPKAELAHIILTECR